MNSEPNWGPAGLTVYERTYQRVKADGTKENWLDTVTRVVNGNMALVYGDDWSEWTDENKAEAHELFDYLYDFRLIPAGRHLRATGVPGRQFVFNCHVAGWGERFSDHFVWTFERLMEGGGVGGNFGSEFLKPYGPVPRRLNLHIVCDPDHPDYQTMSDAGDLSTEYDHRWTGAFQVEDSREGWAEALADFLDTYFAEDVKHQNRVYDVSNVREAGRRLKTFGGTASGPAPFAAMLVEIAEIMNGSYDRFWALPWEQRDVDEYTDHVTPLEAMSIVHAVAKCVVSGGNRRSARMAMVPWDDPYIFDFLSCKLDGSQHWTTNISVAIDDRFLELIREGGPADEFDHAERVHALAVSGMLENGEPGYWNYSLSQVGEVQEVICTNPCGEITLTAWENCCIGSVNLEAFVDSDGNVNNAQLHRAHELMTRFLIRATFGDVTSDKQAAVLAQNRRIGVGHTGVQGHLVKRGIRWSEAPEMGFGSELERMYSTVRAEARRYAFELRIPEPVKVTDVAPTGSTSKLAGCTEGAHPLYALYFINRVRFSANDPDQVAQVRAAHDAGLTVELDVYDKSGKTVVVEYPTKARLVDDVEAMGYPPELVESADEISLEDMLKFQAMYQLSYADNAVSFTANIPVDRYTPEEAGAVLAKWLPKLKGTTLFPDASREQQPLERITRDEYEAAAFRLTGDGIDEECANGVCPI